MNTLKQNTVHDITFDCSISHKSENLIRQQSRQSMSNWDQDYGVNLNNTSLLSMNGGNSNSTTPVSGLSRKTSLENIQPQQVNSYSTSPSLSRPNSMTSMGQFVRHGSQESMQSLSRGNSAIMNAASGFPVGGQLNVPNNVVNRSPNVMPPTPPSNANPTLIRTYSGNASTSFSQAREYLMNSVDVIDSSNEIGRLTLQNSNRSIDSASTLGSFMSGVPPSNSPLTTSRGNRSFLRGNSSNNSSSNSIVVNDTIGGSVAMQSPRGLGYGHDFLDDSELRLGGVPPVSQHSQSHNRLPIPPSYNSSNNLHNNSNNNLNNYVDRPRTLQRPDSDYSINSNGPTGGSRHSRNSSQGSIGSMGSFQGSPTHNVSFPSSYAPQHNHLQQQSQQQQHSMSHPSASGQSLPPRSVHSQNQYDSFYGEPVTTVTLSGSSSFYMKDLDSILSLSTTPTSSTHNLHSLIPQEHPRSRNHSSHSLLGDQQQQQVPNYHNGNALAELNYGSNLDKVSSSFPMSDLNAGSYIVNNQAGYKSHNSSTRSIHQLMSNMYDPELDLIGPNEPLTVDLAGILNSL